MSKVPTWGYKAGEARIFDLEAGESLPSGWVDSPAKVGAEKSAPAEVPDEPIEAEPAPEAVSEGPVPANWRDLHWKQRVKLAKDLTGNAEIASTEDADAAIEAYLNG